MMLDFYKYHGAGNDFILIDNRSNTIELSEQQILFMCDRHFGIGADGLMLLNSSTQGDFKMIYYNSNGKEGSMCGNGGRCMIKFASDLGLIKSETTFEATDGIHMGIVNENGERIKLKMIDVKVVEQYEDRFFINTGSPHHIEFHSEISTLKINHLGEEIRYSDLYKPDGANINFVCFKNNQIQARTYERGVENETLACGTGAVACAIASSLKYSLKMQPIEIQMPGGNLSVYFKKNKGSFYDIWLEGPAKFVFKGSIDVSSI